MNNCRQAGIRQERNRHSNRYTKRQTYRTKNRQTDRVRNTEDHTDGTGPQADRLRTETERKFSDWGERKEKNS
jgi:hypothetical protein